jgi:hypothetical protein
MDIRLDYQDIIKNILKEHSEYRSRGDDDIQSQVVFDDEHQRYLVLDMGWDDKEYWHTTPIHVDVIGGKIWIQYDDTEDGIATDLLEAGVPEDDIVLGFHHPQVRPFTEFEAG